MQLLQALQADTTIPALPCLSKCPVCGRDNCLEIVNGYEGDTVYRCADVDCAFVGDHLDLYCAVKNLRIEEALPCLLRDDLLNSRDEHLLEDMNSYELFSKNRQAVRSFWSTANLRFQQKSTHAASLMGKLGLAWQGIWTPSGLGKHVGVATGYEVFETLNLPKCERKGLKTGRTYTVIPLWSDPLTFTGLTLLWEEGDEILWTNVRFKFIPEQDIGLGFAQSYHVYDDTLLIYTDPLDAITAINDFASCGQRTSLVYALPNTQALRRIPARTKIVVNIKNDFNAYRIALANGPCKTINRPITQKDKDLIELNRCTDLQEIVKFMSVSTYKALSDYLTSLEPSMAQFEIQRLDLDSSDANKIISCGDSLNRNNVIDLFKAETANKRCKLGRNTVLESVDGWIVETKEGMEVVSDTRFTIDTVFWDSEQGVGIASGFIYQREEELPFQSPLNEIESNAYRWLQRKLLEANKQIPIVRSSWKSKLLDLSKLFKKPRTKHASTVSAWEDQRLILPQIIIEGGQIRNNDECSFMDVVGAGLGFPNPLTDNERRALSYKSPHTAVYWALFCSVARNVLAPIHRGGSTGIAIVEQKRGLLSRVLDRMKAEIGVETVTFESPSNNYLKQISDLERRCPFPIFVDEQWNSSRGFKRWLDTGTKRNCIVRMGTEVRACTALQGGWTYLVSDKDEGDGWMALEGLWRIFPQFIAFMQRTPVGRWEDRSYLLTDQIMDMIKAWLEQDLSIEAGTVLNNAKKLCSQDQTDTESAWGSRFVSFLVDAMTADRIRLRPDTGKYDIGKDLILVPEDMVFVSQKAISKLFKDLGVQEFAPNDIRNRLSAIKVLKSRSFNKSPGYGIDIFQWNLTSSSRASLL